jgi:hypothetical protein
LRALTWLGGATLVAVLFAIIAQWQRGTVSVAEFEVVRMFPGLEARVDDVATIHVEAKAAAFNVSRRADGQWILPDKDNFRADFNTVRRTVLGLARLDLIQKRTSRADWQEKLGLTLPKSGGTGTIVTLKDAKGEVLASLVVGSPVEGASVAGKQAVFVRRLSDPQTFVARGDFLAEPDQSQWLDKTFIDIARDRVRLVAVKPFTGPSYSVTRAKPEVENFSVVERIPSGRTLRSEGEPNGIGNGLLGLSFTDAVPQAKVDFSRSAFATFRTFDGLALNLRIVEKEGDYWMALDAIEDTAAASPPAAGKDAKLHPNVAVEVKEINAMASGWAYKIPRFKGALLTAPFDALFAPQGGKPANPGR